MVTQDFSVFHAPEIPCTLLYKKMTFNAITLENPHIAFCLYCLNLFAGKGKTATAVYHSHSVSKTTFFLTEV